jgi:hypothetical protein
VCDLEDAEDLQISSPKDNLKAFVIYQIAGITDIDQIFPIITLLFSNAVAQ